MYYVYLLKNLFNKELYVGSTTDLKKRFKEHNEGKIFSTKRYKPWTLLYYEAYINECLARLREKKLKHHGNSLRELKKRTLLDIDKNGAGFTQIELMIAIGISAILFGIVTINLAGSQRKASLSGEVNKFVSDLKQQQIKSMVGDDGGSNDYGIRIQLTQYTLFKNSYNTNNFVVSLPSNIQATSTYLSGDVIFSKGSGEVGSGQNTITLTDTVTNTQKVITVNKYGVITGVN